MKSIIRYSIALLIGIYGLSLQAQDLVSPQEFFGFEPGADQMLFDYEKLIEYFKMADSNSSKVEIREIGVSPEGKKLYCAFISSEKNINSLDELKVINKELALNNNLDESKLKEYVEGGRVFSMATLSMHSNEVGPSQASPKIVYELITSEDADIQSWLNDVVFMLVPCHNPDGMDMVVNHYNKYKGTQFEGSQMPGIYHKYVGHDNNRDFVTLTQSDNKAIAKVYSTEWYPQVFVEKHQMGAAGVRYFVPPMHDPIAENIDETVWNWTRVFGSNMSKEMTKDGLAGVSQQYLFDEYWPGATTTALWKNVVAMLTEAASVQYAKPIYVEPNEISVYGKGLSEHKKSINLPLPWKGGWWHLSDIVEYERVSTLSLLKTSSMHKEEILRFRNDICKKSIQQGSTEAPYYFIFPREQHDKSELASLVGLLKDHGVKSYFLEKDIKQGIRFFRAGDIVVPLAQPYRAFIKEVLEKQYYPERHHTPGGKLIKPYDITSWSLAMHKGLESYQIDEKIDLELKEIENAEEVSIEMMIMLYGQKMAFSVNQNANYSMVFKLLNAGKLVERALKEFTIRGQKYPAGTFIINSEDYTSGLGYGITYFDESPNLVTEKLNSPKIALVETWYHDMDAGWTRWVMDEYAIPFTVVRPIEIGTIDLNSYDMIMFPDADKNVLLEGKYKSKEGSYFSGNYPPEYIKGMGKDGLSKLMKYVNDGGKVISWGRSSTLFMGDQTITLDEKKKIKEEFVLPITDISAELVKQGLYCPGTLLSINLKSGHPICYGLKENLGVFSRANPVFKTSIPYFDMDRRVIGSYAEKDIVVSGYAEKSKLLTNQPAIVWLKKGKGQLVLMGFNPQFRGSTTGTFKLLFNSIFL